MDVLKSRKQIYYDLKCITRSTKASITVVSGLSLLRESATEVIATIINAIEMVVKREKRWYMPFRGIAYVIRIKCVTEVNAPQRQYTT